MKAVHPYLNFAGNTEQAFHFYRSVFGGEFAAVVRFRDFPDNGMGVDEADLDRIAHIALPIGPQSMLMATDCVGEWARNHRPGNNVYITLEPDSAEEATRLFDALSADGAVEMPLGATEWAELYGSCTDRYGVRWMVSYTGTVVFNLGGES